MEVVAPTKRRGPSDPDAVAVTSLEYSSCMNVIDSDHKPVYSFLTLNIPITDMVMRATAR